MDAFLVVAGSMLGAMMVADTLTLAFRLNRTSISAWLLLAVLVCAIASIVSGGAFPALCLLRALAGTIVLVAVYHGSEVPEHDHLWVPVMWLPAYLGIELFYLYW
jgi:hypothetical protein